MFTTHASLADEKMQSLNRAAPKWLFCRHAALTALKYNLYAYIHINTIFFFGNYVQKVAVVFYSAHFLTLSTESWRFSRNHVSL